MSSAMIDPRAPMSAAPMQYNPDGSVDWGNMWDSFCALARSGGPPHRGTLLAADESANPNSAAYQAVVDEIIRGVWLVSGLPATAAGPGWVAIECPSAEMARWLAESIIEENVQARSEQHLLFVPAGEHFTLKGEIKNVITVVAKTTHYWREHLPPDAKRALAAQAQLGQFKQRLLGWLGR